MFVLECLDFVDFRVVEQVERSGGDGYLLLEEGGQIRPVIVGKLLDKLLAGGGVARGLDLGLILG